MVYILPVDASWVILCYLPPFTKAWNIHGNAKSKERWQKFEIIWNEIYQIHGSRNKQGTPMHILNDPRTFLGRAMQSLYPFVICGGRISKYFKIFKEGILQNQQDLKNMCCNSGSNHLQPL